ncbi:hypothetical protein CXR04_29835 [Streptomyces sp. CMB-StM0423]|nr:hypothetical protein CXR04_29835 [Streptomyces sp. CMB-StM0423]
MPGGRTGVLVPTGPAPGLLGQRRHRPDPVAPRWKPARTPDAGRRGLSAMDGWLSGGDRRNVPQKSLAPVLPIKGFTSSQLKAVVSPADLRDLDMYRPVQGW